MPTPDPGAAQTPVGVTLASEFVAAGSDPAELPDPGVEWAHGVRTVDDADPAALLARRRALLAARVGAFVVRYPETSPPTTLPAPVIHRGAIATDGRADELMTVSPPPLPDADLDHWSLDVDHDRRMLRVAATGDGAPPREIRVRAPAHDAPREIVLHLVAVDGRRWVSSAVTE